MALSDNMRAAVLMNIAMLAFTFNDTSMKLASENMPLFQAIALRGGVTVVVLIAIAAQQETGSWALAAFMNKKPATKRTIFFI